jgi:peptidoglycan hydrolase-like protein with peptidoglycan-binding domain
LAGNHEKIGWQLLNTADASRGVDQIELYNQGYYSGPIDGIIGPDTQAAIADYQADYGLPVTAAIDEPTVESLGLV